MQNNKPRDRWRRWLKRLFFPVLKWAYSGYRKKERTFRFKGLRVIVPSSVFHPGYLLSTKILTTYLDKLAVHGKMLLEIGCGSGLLSLYAARKGAIVTASDINPAAVKGLINSSINNGLDIAVFESDLFNDLPSLTFDYVFINPPYYPRNPANDEEKAFYCGSDFEFFHRLFNEMHDFVDVNSCIYMILSEDCDVERIKGIGEAGGFDFTEVHREKKMWEWNYIYELQK